MDFDEIYETYFDKVYGKILSLVKNPEDTEDIAQDVFVSIYKNLSKFRNESSIYTWIYRITLNKTYDFFRKKKDNLEINEEILADEEEISIEDKILLKDKLKTLQPKEKDIVILKDIYGYKLKEIGKMKNMNLSTVKSVYYKALKNLEVDNDTKR